MVNLAADANSPAHYAKGTRSPVSRIYFNVPHNSAAYLRPSTAGPRPGPAGSKCHEIGRTLKKMRDIGLPQLVGTRFQVLFTPLTGVLFTFQSPYLFTIGRDVVLSLGWWSTRLHTAFHVSRATLERPFDSLGSAYGAVTLYGWPFQTILLATLSTSWTSATPIRRSVWAIPLSLAATYGVSFDFLSSGYLDVSVPRVGPERPMNSAAGQAIWLAPVTWGCPIRKSQDQSILTTPLGLSQPDTSFIASSRLGIHHVPLVT